MITAYFVYGVVLFVVFALFRNRRWLELAILGVPSLFCGYFLLSIGIFSFGEDMPFTYYNPTRKDEYGYVSVMVCLHFLTVIGAFLFVGQFDKRPYSFNQMHRFQSLGLGTAGALFCLLPALFVFLSAPLSSLWYRSTFVLESETKSWLRFGDLMVFISALLIPFIRNRVLKYSILWSVTISFLCLGSRTAIGVLLVFSMVNIFVLKKTRNWVSILHLFAALWLLGTILLLRIHNVGGIANVVEVALFGEYIDILEQLIYGFNYNFNLSFILIAELIDLEITESRWFYYGILPLPSAIFDQTEQYDASNRFRVNIPYSGFGYALAYMGPVAYLALAFVSSVAFLVARKVISVKRDIYESILCFSIFTFPLIILLQYNLRTGTRIAYFFLIIYFLVALWRRGVFAPGERHAGRGRT